MSPGEIKSFQFLTISSCQFSGRLQYLPMFSWKKCVSEMIQSIWCNYNSIVCVKHPVYINKPIIFLEMGRLSILILLHHLHRASCKDYFIYRFLSHSNYLQKNSSIAFPNASCKFSSLNFFHLGSMVIFS